MIMSQVGSVRPSSSPATGLKWRGRKRGDGGGLLPERSWRGQACHRLQSSRWGSSSGNVAHRFGAAGQDRAALPTADPHGGLRDRFHARGAVALHRQPGHVPAERRPRVRRHATGWPRRPASPRCRGSPRPGVPPASRRGRASPASRRFARSVTWTSRRAVPILASGVRPPATIATSRSGVFQATISAASFSFASVGSVRHPPGLTAGAAAVPAAAAIRRLRTLLPQFSLQQLAQRRARELVEEFELRRHLVRAPGARGTGAFAVPRSASAAISPAAGS